MRNAYPAQLREGAFSSETIFSKITKYIEIVLLGERKCNFSQVIVCAADNKKACVASVSQLVQINQRMTEYVSNTLHSLVV